MKTTLQHMRGRNGSALFTVLIYSGIAAMAIGAMMTFALNQPRMVTKAVSYAKARAIAEAGANQAYSILATNFAAKDNPGLFPLTPFADGAYDVTIVSNSEKWVTIVSVGTCKLARATAMLDLRNFGGGITGSVTGATGGPGDTNSPGVGAFAYTILSGGKMDWSGSGELQSGTGAKMHANGQFKMTGSKKVWGNISSSVKIWLTGSTVISGDANAPVFNASGSAITGSETVGPVPTITVPDIDLTPYYNEALKNGQVYSSGFTYSGSTDYTVPGGIMWVTGDFKLSGSGDFIGCVIATGDVKWSGSGDQIKVGNYPAIVSRDGDIDISGSGKFHGLIYAKTGGFDKSGSGDVWGSIICNGDFDASGSWCLMTYENSTPVPPGGGGGTSGTGSATTGKAPDIIVPTAWVQ